MNIIASALFFFACAYASAADWYVPAVMLSSGSDDPGTLTNLRIYNPNDVPVDFEFSSIGAAGAPLFAPRRFLIAPRQMLAGDDLSGAVTGALGASTLRIRASRTLTISAWAANTASVGGSTQTDLAVVNQAAVLEGGESSYALWIDSPDGEASEALSAGVVLLGTSSQVDVLAFDATGKELGRKSISGAEQSVELSVSSFARGDAPVARMNFLVRSGRAIGYARLQNALGLSDLKLARRSFTGAVQWFVGGGRKLTADDGAAEQTDLRLFNLAPTEAKVIIRPLGDATLGATPVILAVGSRQTLDIRDVFGTRFGAERVVSAGLSIESESTVLVAARQFQANADGKMGVFGEALAVSLAEELPGTAQVLRILGVRNIEGGPSTSLLFQSGAAGVTGTITIRDSGGNVILQSDGPARGSFQSFEIVPVDLLPLGQWPEEAIVEFSIGSGSALFASRVSTPNSAAPYVAQSHPDEVYECPLPVIRSFMAGPKSLVSAGPVDLFWYSDGDSVKLQPLGAAVTATGETTVTVSDTSTYTLEATNACGVTRQALTVAVGAPKAASVSPASAPPGTLITIRTSGVDEISTITGVNFTFGGQLQSVSSIEAVLDENLISVRVPFVLSNSNPQGYVTGAGSLALNFGSGTTPTPIPFTVLPLPASGDPVAELRQLIEFFDKSGRALLNENAIAASIALPSPAEAALEEALGVLRKAADDLAASGVAPMRLPPVATSPIYNLTRADVQLLFALMHGVNGPGPLTTVLNPLVDKNGVRQLDAKQSPCIQDEDKLYAACLRASFIPTDNVLKEVQGWLSNVAEAAEKWPVLKALGTWIERASMATKLTCYLAPLIIDSLSLSPSSEVPINRVVDRMVTAAYRPYWNKDKIVVDQMAPITKRYLEQAAARVQRGESPSVVAAWYQAKVAAQQKIVEDFATFAVKVANASPLAAIKERRLGKCELADVQPDAKSSKILRRKVKEEDNTKVYKFRGGSPGGEAAVNAWLDYSEAIEFDRGQFRPARGTNGAPTKFQVQVGRPNRLLKVTSVTSSRQRGPIVITGGGPLTIKPWQSGTRTAMIDANRCTLRAEGVSPNDFRIVMDGLRESKDTPGIVLCEFKASFLREKAFDDDQNIIMTTSVTGKAADRLSGWVGTDPSTKVTFSGTTNGTPGAQTFDLMFGPGVSINSSQAPLTSKGASQGNITAKVYAHGGLQSVHIKTRLQFPDDWEEK